MNHIATAAFFERPALEVAPDLLGKYLVQSQGEQEQALLVTEVEAYLGEQDKASHARFGKTKRNAVMYGPAGVWYLYLIYGMHWMLNIVVEQEGNPAAILIRGTREVTGPGRITKHLSLDKSFHQLPAQQSTGLWFEDRGVVLANDAIQATPRIGIDYAAEWVHKPYRFLIHYDQDST